MQSARETCGPAQPHEHRKEHRIVIRKRRPRVRGPFRVSALALTLATLISSAGCFEPARLHTVDRYRAGVVFVLPGIEGRSFANYNIAVGLDEGGVPSAIEIYDWTIGVPGAQLANLALLPRNKEKAAQLAQRIVAHQDNYPGTPVHLVGHSGGAGLLVLAMEALPADRRVDSAVLLAPALTPDYDLSRSLLHVSRMYNFYSNLDLGLLGLGTSLFGTIDRDFGPSAGAIGFQSPFDAFDASADLYRARLTQVEWTPELMRVGATGNHFGWSSRTFARLYLAPLLKNRSLPTLP